MCDNYATKICTQAASQSICSFVWWLMNRIPTHPLPLSLSLSHSSHSWLHSWHHNAAVAVRTRWQTFGNLSDRSTQPKRSKAASSGWGSSFTLICQNLIKPRVGLFFPQKKIETNLSRTAKHLKIYMQPACCRRRRVAHVAKTFDTTRCEHIPQDSLQWGMGRGHRGGCVCVCVHLWLENPTHWQT